MKLRPYQQTALEKFFRSSTRSTLFVAPTGAGKGTMASWLMAKYAREKKKVIFLVHRRELVHDMVERLRQRGVPVVLSAFSAAHVRVLSVQAAMRLELQPVDLLVIDEAHHYAADEWQRVMDGIKARRIVGFTATPERADGRPLGDMFERIVEVVSYSKLLAQGVIVPCRVLRPQRRMLSDEIAQDPVDAYLRYAKGERALIYVRRVSEADAVKERLLEAGIRAGAVHSKMRGFERDQTMLALEDGELDVVVNVGVLTEGVDVPHVTHLVLARPCGHASMYLQIVGRALRSAEGKREACLIDLVGASYKHGLPAEDRVYALEGDAIQRKSDSGPSGPSGRHYEEIEVENLELDLVEVRALTADEIRRRRGLEEEARYREQAREKMRAWREAHPKAPKSRLPPKPITDGFLFQDKGFWNLGWNENGQRKRAGLGGTKDEAEAKELLEIFRTRGPQALKDEVRIRKRDGVSLVNNKASRPFYMVAWNDDRTARIKVYLGTHDRDEAEAIRALWRAGRIDEARERIRRCQEQGAARANKLRGAAAVAQWAGPMPPRGRAAPPP